MSTAVLLAQVQPELVTPDIPTSLELSGRLLLAVLLGGIVGLERELRGQPSGVRTHIAVSLGAALFGVTSAYAVTEFIAVREVNNYSLDPTRIAAQVVSGIGFLGGGAIIKQGVNVRGLTSAAGLWVSAAIGLSVAFGMYVESIVGTLALVLSLWLLKGPARWLRHRGGRLRSSVHITMHLDANPAEVIALLSDLPDTIVRSIEIDTREEDDILVIEVQVQGQAAVIRRALPILQHRQDVISAELE